MLVITNEQMEAFRQVEVEKFVQKSLVFLRGNFGEWCEGKEQGELEGFIREMIGFGEGYNIKKQRNLQKLMFLKIEYGVEVPLNEELEKVLMPFDNNETYRVTQFYKNLTKPKNNLKIKDNLDDENLETEFNW